ncbi:late cornified envelope protein 3D-like [Sarcophilus harrisii]
MFLHLAPHPFWFFSRELLFVSGIKVYSAHTEMSCQQNQQQCQPPPKCQTPKISPPTPCLPPVTSGCSSSSGGCGSSGSEGGCHLFSHHRRSHGYRHESPGCFDSNSVHNLLSGGCGSSSGGCSGSSGDCGGSSGGCC